MFRTSIVLVSLVATACASPSPSHARVTSGLDGTRTLSSLDAAESRTLCEAFVAHAEREIAHAEARTFACTERALLSPGLETPESCEDYVAECTPGVAYESSIDCATYRFDSTCDVSVALFELCATEHVARITGVGRYPIDCSLAGTEDVAAALAAEPWEDCVGFDPACMIDD